MTASAPRPPAAERQRSPAAERNRDVTRCHFGNVFDKPFIDYAQLAKSMGWYAEGPIDPNAEQSRDILGVWSDVAALASKDFASFTPSEIQLARAAVTRLAPFRRTRSPSMSVSN